MLRASSILLGVTLAFASVACGGSQRPPSAPTETQQDELIRYRAALADLRRNPLAGEATVDLEKASAWLETAQGLLVSEGRTEKTRLYLDAVEAELVKVKSHFARRAAQLAILPQPASTTNPDADDKEEAP
ncbi:MAG: hypothetical protein OZ921_10005 [Sorangiineae bacterium]|nr:hypothetical protein [Polyangiaceae bacterium]MEB2322838.1 hypothetical protein [Sorangiineae bacterium]